MPAGMGGQREGEREGQGVGWEGGRGRVTLVAGFPRACCGRRRTHPVVHAQPSRATPTKGEGIGALRQRARGQQLRRHVRDCRQWHGRGWGGLERWCWCCVRVCGRQTMAAQPATSATPGRPACKHVSVRSSAAALAGTAHRCQRRSCAAWCRARSRPGSTGQSPRPGGREGGDGG